MMVKFLSELIREEDCESYMIREKFLLLILNRANRFKMLFSMCEEFDSRKRTTRASRMAAVVREVSPPSSESEEVR